MKPGTQPYRLLAFLRENPGASRLDIDKGMDPYVANITGRISEVRAYMRSKGGDVVAFKRGDGRDGYRVVEPRPVTTGEPMALGIDETHCLVTDCAASISGRMSSPEGRRTARAAGWSVSEYAPVYEARCPAHRWSRVPMALGLDAR